MKKQIIEKAYWQMEKRNAIEPEPWKKLALHILAMADDDYLMGHPEWEEIVKEAINL